VSTSRRRPSVTLGVLCIGVIAYSLQQSLLAPALPDIERELVISEAAASWLLTAYLVCASVATPIAGRLGDLLGKRRVLLWVLAVLAVGTAMSAIAHSLGLLLAGRVLQGASGGIFPLAYGIVRDELPEDRIAGGIGLISSLLGVGGGAGVVLAGLILQQLSYHWLFWIPLCVVLIAFVATRALVPPSPVRATGAVDWGSAALMSAGLVVTLVALSQTSSWGWLDPRTLALGLLGAVLLAAWIRRDTRSSRPLVDMRLMAHRPVLAANTVALLVGAGMWSAFTLIPRLAQAPEAGAQGFGASVTGSGLFLLPMTATMLFVGPLAGRLEHRFGSRPPLICGLACCTAGLVLLTLTRTEAWQLYAYSGVLGFGIGLAFAAITNIVVEDVAEDATSVATGVNTVMRLLGGAFGVQVGAALLSANPGADGVPAAAGYTAAFAVSALALFGALAAALQVPRPRARRSADRAVANYRMVD
jgi:EmrB/QacA subfamily drug resistance transporter